MPVLITGMIFFSCDHEKNLSPEDGIKAIKVLNSDLINLSDGVSKNLAFAGLSYLLEEPTSPLSTQNGLIGKWLNDTITSLSSLSGKYDWNGNEFIRSDTSNHIEINFQIPGTTGPQGNFILSDFEFKRLISGLSFPLVLNANMLDIDKEILEIKGKSEFSDDLPGKTEWSVKGEDFDATIYAERTREQDKGTLDIKLDFRARGYEIITGTIHSVIGYSGNQVFFRSYEPDVRIFDVRISGKLDYGKVDPTSKDYVKSFNENCHIGFYDKNSGKKIGDFGIGEINNGELLGWALYLSDGKPLFLEDQLIVVEKLLNYKLPNKVRQ